jgi:hypothetical protein
MVKARDVEFIEVSNNVKKTEIADVLDVVGEGIGEDTTISEQSKSQEDENVNTNNSNHHSETENENSEGEANRQVKERHYPKLERKRKEFPDMILHQAVQTEDYKMNEPAEFNEAIKAEDVGTGRAAAHRKRKRKKRRKKNGTWITGECCN